jgi:hypothetical protein
MFELSDLARMCEQFTAKSGITVTEGAMRQIASLINSVQLDPQERWKVQDRQLNDYFERWQDTLPDLLGRVARDHHLQTRITIIDVMYWTAQFGGYVANKLSLPEAR